MTEQLFKTEIVNANSVTLKDIAQIANVSPTAVSNALAGKSNISKAMKDKILQTAEELGYTPNLTARSFNKKNLKIAIILSDNPAPIASQYIDGFKKVIRNYSGAKLECHILTYSTTNEHARAALLQVADNDYDGLIISYPNIHEYKHRDVIKKINEKNIPVVSFVDELSEFKTCGNVMVDACVGGAIAADIIGNCIEKGSVAVFTAVNPLQVIHKSYIEGFTKALEFYGSKIYDIFYSTDVNETAYERAMDCFSQRNCPKAAFATCYNAFEICRALKDLNLEGKIKVVGVDVLDQTRDCLANGSLTAAIFQRQDEQAAKAFSLLMQYIFKDEISQNKQVLITPNIITKSRIERY